MGAVSQLEPLGHAEQFLSMAMKNPTPLAYQVSSATLLHGRQYEEAAAEATRGITSDPNDPDGYLAMAAVLSFTGKAGEALELVQRAMRLNPHYPAHYLYQQGLAEFGLGHLKRLAHRSRRPPPETPATTGRSVCFSPPTVCWVSGQLESSCSRP